jgi:tetratricopeptide (TPR) repeat protein
LNDSKKGEEPFFERTQQKHMRPFVSIARLSVLILTPASLLAHGDLHTQIEQVSKEIRTHPKAELFLKRGELQRAHGEYDSALKDYDLAANADAAMSAVDLCRGKALLEAGRLEQASEALNRFLAKMPSHSEGFLFRARVRKELKQYQEAAKDYSRSIELTMDPRPEHYLERSQAFLKAGDKKEALAGLEAGMVRLGDIATLQSAAIEIDIQEQRYDAALARVDQLLLKAERTDLLLFRRAEILRLSGREIKAQRTYQEVLTAIEALPARLRASKATQTLEREVRQAIQSPVNNRRTSSSPD